MGVAPFQAGYVWGWVCKEGLIFFVLARKKCAAAENNLRLKERK
jgi:hypothetical protein